MILLSPITLSSHIHNLRVTITWRKNNSKRVFYLLAISISQVLKTIGTETILNHIAEEHAFLKHQI